MIYTLRRKYCPQKEEAQLRIENDHAAGIHIAKVYLTPFLRELSKKYGYNRLEIASALLVLAYNVLRKDRPAYKAWTLFNTLAGKTRKHIDKIEIRKLN